MSTLERLVTPVTRVLDVGVRDSGLVDALDTVGARRYLGLVLPEDLPSVTHLPERFRPRFHPLLDPDQIRHNDTDLLVLRAPVARAVWAVRDLHHVGHIAIERDSVASWLDTHGALAVSRLLGRVDHVGASTYGGVDLEVFALRRRQRAQARHYLSETLGVPGLLERLAREGLDYVVLRWFDQLPRLDPGEDLDLLVADRHLTRVHEILAEEPGTIPVDVYSETGLEGADFRGMAYYPPRLATRMLARATTHPSGARVPEPQDHLHSLAYHAVYHKGADSGLASTLIRTSTAPDHDYAAALTAVAESANRTFPTSLEQVDEELEARGWRPPLDTLRRLSDDNPWLRRRFFEASDHHHGELPEPTVFFVRERTLSVLDRGDVLGVIESFEFEILTVRDLSGAGRARSTELVRGGNWGRGPFAVSGGEPVLVVVAVHFGPRTPGQALRERYPRLTNGDVLHVKMAMRQLVEDRVGRDRSFNPVHSSDDEFETWEYVDIALPEESDDLRRRVRQRRADYRTTAPVLKVLSEGRRAKVEVVEGADGRPVVRKTFAPHGRRHLEREIATMRELSPVVPEVPRVTRSGRNWFETEFFTNRLADLPARPDGRLIPLGTAREMVRVLREIHARGIDLVDIKPHNFLVAPDGRLRVVDFEFSHTYEGPAPPFEEIYGFVGPPDDFDGDLPVGEVGYESRWQPFIGLTREALLHEPMWRQHLRRSAFRAAHVGRAPVRVTRAGARRGRTALRATRARTGAAYRAWAHARSRVLS